MSDRTVGELLGRAEAIEAEARHLRAYLSALAGYEGVPQAGWDRAASRYLRRIAATAAIDADAEGLADAGLGHIGGDCDGPPGGPGLAGGEHGGVSVGLGGAHPLDGLRDAS